jgi:predicted regulator of Ras-like GTPase activity (Roadblock/LC7/MglB family)
VAQAAGPAHAAAPVSALDQALDLLAQTPGVDSVLLVDRAGLLIDGRGIRGDRADAVSATAYETWNLAKGHMVRMRLGTLHLASLFTGQRVFVLAPCNPGVLAIAAEPAVKMGLINRRVETARNLLVSA